MISCVGKVIWCVGLWLFLSCVRRCLKVVWLILLVGWVRVVMLLFISGY